MPVNINIKGIDVVKKQLLAFGDEGNNAINNVTSATATIIETEAKSKAPVDTGYLRQNIATQKITKKGKFSYNYIVTSYAPYSAYMEFGTGKKVQIPPEFAAIASYFKGKGIKEINLLPRPFMYPSFLKGRNFYLDELKSALKRLIKKHG